MRDGEAELRGCAGTQGQGSGETVELRNCGTGGRLIGKAEKLKWRLATRLVGIWSLEIGRSRFFET